MATAAELSAIRQACGELRPAVSFLRSALQPGLTERQTASRLRDFFRRRGYRRWAFPFIVAAGPSAANPHHAPTGRRLRRGDLVVCDFGLRIRQTASDLSRTFILGRPTKKFRRVYAAVLTAQAKAIAALRSGRTGREVDAVARAILNRRGFGKAFLHGTGHGVGHCIHQPPWLSTKGSMALQPGDVVTVEPGVYLKGWGGVRIEDMYLITNRGAQRLTAVPSSLKSAIISP